MENKLSREEELKKLKEMASEIEKIPEEPAEKEEKTKDKPKQLVLKSENRGFISKIMIALLAGFAGGAVITAIYIYLNISKFTFTF